MSGGHWDYLSRKLEERAEFGGNIWTLLAQLEHELDWGLSCDTCLRCARKRVAASLEAYFDGGASGIGTALAIARDSQQHLCHQCDERR